MAGTAGELKLRVRDASVQYQHSRTGRLVLALDGISLDVHQDELICVVGPSGSGKSTLLGAIAGLVPVMAGTIEIDGRPVTGPGSDRAMVFQQASLLPWRTVLGNVQYGLELRKHDRADAQRQAERFIRLVGLQGYEQSYPHEISGGMQQRVNLARALAIDPAVLLMDEPFASLDAQTREFMQLEVMKILTATAKAVLFVTHQISEAVYLGDRVVVFTAGPARVRDVVVIDLPRPRPLGIKRSPEFMAYEERIWSQIVDEVRKAGIFTEEPEPVPGPTSGAEGGQVSGGAPERR